MGFQQGLSGLDAASQNLDVIGSNVANANTVGYKKSTAEFGDVYARSLVGATDNQVGQGVSVTRVSQSFTQGNVTNTGNPLDIAINGTGFYRMVDASSGQVSYTRNGQFQTDKNGYIISATGQNLTGYGVDNIGKVNTAVLTNLKIPVNDLAPLATTNTAFGVNLDAAATPPTTTPFSATNSATFNHSVSEQVYDGTGTAHMLTNYYVNTGPGTWAVYSQVDGNNPTGGNPVSTLTFNASGALTTNPSKVAVAFGGMSIAAGLCSYLLMTREARLGLNGPQVIEQEAGIEEYDSRDRPFIWSLTGGEQRAATGLTDVCIEDDSVSIRAQVIEWLQAGAPKYQRSEQVDRYLEQLAAVDTSRQATAEDVRSLYAKDQA